VSLRQRTYLILSLGTILVIGFVGFEWWNGRAPVNPETLLLKLTTQDAVVAGLDFDALRSSGVLSSLFDTKGPQEAEYVDFVRDSGFNYQRDLHYVLAAFAPDGEFFFIRGAFDWSKLERYVASQKGSCADHLCRLEGSTPEKKISFFRVRNDLMAMAVAQDPAAATRLKQPGPQDDVIVPKEPAWLTFSAGALRHAAASRGSFSGSSRLFATAIMDAERVTITAGPSTAGNLGARLEAVCRDPQQAGGLVEQMQGLTRVLKSVAAQQTGQQGQSTSADSLGALIASGTFSQAGSHVVGNWTIPGSLLAGLAATR
jgi:hypothetical protein